MLDHQLPQVVHCRTPVLYSNAHDDRTQPPVLLDHPIILADQRTARHLLAKIVVFDQRTGSFNESADSVVIPEDYDGHFLRLQSRTTKDRTHVQSLQSIAHGDTPAFLNLTNMTSFPVDAHDQSRMVYTVGNVFLVDEPLPPTNGKPNGVHERRVQSEKGDDNSSGLSANSRPKSEKSSAHSQRSPKGFMRCLDERGLPVLVPTNQKGDMVSVQSKGAESTLSVKCSEMIENGQFPLLARFAYGRKPPRLNGFTKLFTLLDSFQENSIIACTMNGATLTLFEIPVTSSLQFQVALNRDELLSVPRMRKTLDTCRTLGHEFASDIKFKYKFSHRVQETSRRMMKLRERDEDDMPSATMRTRLVVTESYVYV